ncbi:MAG TPA: phosphoribosyltransferase [Acidimicrobiales bacterium]|nr:phosphoribosyltransferase [Acidimicrobiales bacterium]
MGLPVSFPGKAFRDRADAGRALAERLRHYAGASDLLVLGLPRGGVPVAYEVATALSAPLDVFVVRKLGVPGRAELAMGAIADGGVRIVNRSITEPLRLSDAVVEEVAAQESVELVRRQQAYRAGRAALDVTDKVTIVVDDGLATGATMRAAVAALRAQVPRRIVAAVPVGARSTCAELGAEVYEVVCVRSPIMFQAVGQWYEDFSPTTDEEIGAILARTQPPSEAPGAG